MTYLVDTNVVSELRRKSPAPQVLAWFSQRPAATLYLSVLTIGELRKGVELLADPARKAALHQWLSIDLPTTFRAASSPSTHGSSTAGEGCLPPPDGLCPLSIACSPRQRWSTTSSSLPGMSRISSLYLLQQSIPGPTRKPAAGLRGTVK